MAAFFIFIGISQARIYSLAAEEAVKVPQNSLARCFRDKRYLMLQRGLPLPDQVPIDAIKESMVLKLFGISMRSQSFLRKILQAAQDELLKIHGGIM